MILISQSVMALLLPVMLLASTLEHIPVYDLEAQVEAIRTIESQFEHFKAKFNKTYGSFDEEQTAKKNFVSTLKFIAEHNTEYVKGLQTYEMGINRFADSSDRQVADLLNGYDKTLGSQRDRYPGFKRRQFQHAVGGDTGVPDSIDWREKGAVTNVKNQGHCGSCWAFSATGSLEGQRFIKKGYLTSLSEQNLVDCSRDEGNNGCNGGLMDNAFQYIYDNDGIDTEAEYPYTARNGKCHYRPDGLNITDDGAVDIPSGDERALKEAVARIGPISVAIDASSRNFQMYTSGVFQHKRCSSKNLDHGVLVVGYGTDKKTGLDYWIVKNSWGREWGDKGYIKMARNRKNMCGVATEASYPIVD